MTRPRKELISLADTPYYHIVSRCVRRAFLCGFDHQSQRDYEHRRQWVEARIRLLSSIFAIDICAYAVMSNHYHLVVKLDPCQIDNLTTQDVISRWTSLFKGPLLIQRQQQGASLSAAEQQTVSDIVDIWRQRLTDLGWFMKCLNETIAREANKEDDCTGHFWESRYKSQALLTEEALLSCMVYVDLNPIRAVMAKTPETSDHTSIKERIHPQFTVAHALSEIQDTPLSLAHFLIPLKPLLHFDGDLHKEVQLGIPFHLKDYLHVVDWTGRVIREDKHGSITQTLPPILQRLSIEEKQWVENSAQFERRYRQRFQKRKAKTA
jgi:REP element-mobilizing transposase RayT